MLWILGWVRYGKARSRPDWHGRWCLERCKLSKKKERSLVLEEIEFCVPPCIISSLLIAHQTILQKTPYNILIINALSSKDTVVIDTPGAKSG